MYGYGDERYYEYRRAVESKNYGPLVGTSMTRCIVCTRCTRFTNEFAGVDDIGKLGRGLHAEISTYIDKTLDNELSGNIVDLCPVGALLSLPYSFTSRSHELRSTYSIDVLDSLGSNIQIDARNSEVRRILPKLNEAINQEWLSDKTRHGWDGLKRQRISHPYVRNKTTGNLEEADLEKAMHLIAQRLQQCGPEEVAAVFGEFTDLETMTTVKDFVNKLGSDNFEIRSG